MPTPPSPMHRHIHHPPTGLLFSSLAMLSLSVKASDTQKPTRNPEASENPMTNEADKLGETKTAVVSEV